MSERNGRIWTVVALATSLVVAIAGWAFAGVQAGRMQTLTRLQAQTDRVEEHSMRNERDIAVINAKLDTIIESVKKIEGRLK